MRRRGAHILLRFALATAFGLLVALGCAEVMQTPQADTNEDALVGTVGRRPTSEAGPVGDAALPLSDAQPPSDPGSAPPSDPGSAPPTQPATQAPTQAPTQPPTAPMRETCNGQDDDGNGQVDDLVMCPCNVVQRGGTAYLVCGQRMSWSAGRALCEEIGYRLIQIDDADEDAFVYAQMQMRGLGDTWIGLTDQGAEGVWQWSDGSALVYTHWDSGEPNNGGQSGEDCGLVMAAQGRESEWDDRPCDGERPFVCEVAP